MTKYSKIVDHVLEDAIIRELGLDPQKVIDTFGSTHDFFQKRIHEEMYHQKMDGYGKNTRVYQPIVDGINTLQKEGLKLTVITARREELEGILEKTTGFVQEHFGDVYAIHRVQTTEEKKQYMEHLGVWIDDSYGKLVPFLQEKGIYVVKRRLPFNENLPCDTEIVQVHSLEQPWVKEVLKYCDKKGIEHIGTDLDDTVTPFRARIHRAEELYVQHYPEEVKRLSL